MGPRPFGRGRLAISPNCQRPCRSLQWGRDLSVAEGGKALRCKDKQAQASMGPRPFGRGRAPRASELSKSCTLLQWGRDLSVAEGIDDERNAVVAAMLQWGRDLSVAEGSSLIFDVHVQEAASMGPRPFGRGRPAARLPPQLFVAASMGPRPFGRGRITAARHSGNHVGCFNGAATFRSRKARQPMRRKRGRALQWGRDLSVAEGAKDLEAFCARLPASMGPRPFGRGRPARIPLARPHPPASMGPRPFGRGRLAMLERRPEQVGLQWGRDLSVAEGPCASAGILTPAMLQWGRDLSVAEGSRWCRRAQPLRRFNGAATFRSRKVHTPTRRSPSPHPASMGPRPFGRGRQMPYRTTTVANLLQWGRDLSVAEGVAARLARLCVDRFNGAATFRSRKALAQGGTQILYGQLQWGRDLSVAEGRLTGSSSSPCRWRFNGAATFRSRKADLDRARHEQARRFNGAATFRSRKAARRRHIRNVPRRFNGAATFRSRKGDYANLALVHQRWLQWGRDLSVAEGIKSPHFSDK